MGASAAVAIMIRKEKDIVEHLRRHGALDASTARIPGDLDVETGLAWRRLRADAVVREAAPGTYYLDELSWSALQRHRRKGAIIAVVIAIFALLTVLLAGGNLR